MAALPFVVLRMLADGRFHSGEAIARTAGMSRGSVWLAVRELERAGLEVQRVRGRGYRLPRPVSLLERDAIMLRLGRGARHFSLDLVDGVDSTNTVLLRRASAGAAHATVLVAEHQSAGRGRMGRVWHAAIGGGITFSLLWRFEQGAGALAGLSLATGVALTRAFERLGVGGAALKWPNDVMWNGAKLAGILIEMQGDALGPSWAVIGVGVNVRLNESVRSLLEQPVADLESACGRSLDRNEVLALTLEALGAMLEDFSRFGFAPLREEWQRRHAHQDRMVTLSLPDGRVQRGTARGVTEGGALLLEAQHEVRHYHAGEVSLHPAGGPCS